MVFFDIDGDEGIWSTPGGLSADRWRDELFVNHGTAGVLLLGEDGSEELPGTPAVANRRRR